MGIGGIRLGRMEGKSSERDNWNQRHLGDEAET